MALQHMPAARGLFHSAAAMSPVAKLGMPHAEAATFWREAVRPTGCADRACLLGVSAAALVALNPVIAGDFGTIPDPSIPAVPNVDYVVADSSLKDEWALNGGFAVDVPLLVVLCREQGAFAAVQANYEPYGRTAPAWPLTPSSFGAWGEAAGMEAEDARAAYRLYASVEDAEQRWYQIGNDVTLFCGVRASVTAEAKARTKPVYLSLVTTAVAYTGTWGDIKYAAEGIDVYLTWGLTAARTIMGLAELPKEAKAVGDSMRASLVSLARKGALGDEWQPHPAVCEIGEPSVACSTENRHAQACGYFDQGIGRKYDLALG